MSKESNAIVLDEAAQVCEAMLQLIVAGSHDEAEELFRSAEVTILATYNGFFHLWATSHQYFDEKSFPAFMEVGLCTRALLKRVSSPEEFLQFVYYIEWRGVLPLEEVVEYFHRFTPTPKQWSAVWKEDQYFFYYESHEVLFALCALEATDAPFDEWFDAQVVVEEMAEEEQKPNLLLHGHAVLFKNLFLRKMEECTLRDNPFMKR